MIDAIIAQLKRGECSDRERHEAPCATCDAVAARIAWLRERVKLPVIATCGRCPVHADFGPEYSDDVAEAMGPWSPNGTQWACGNDAELRSTRPDEAPPEWCSLRGAP